MEQFERNIWAIGKEKQKALFDKKILVIGVGGVGGTVIELLARAGVGTIDICDGDTVDITNLNRQIIATHKTIGKKKVNLWAKRIKEINPLCNVEKFAHHYSDETKEKILAKDYDMVVDAFDQFVQKADLVIACSRRKLKVIHAMGAANRMDPTKFKYGKLKDVKSDHLAKLMISELNSRNKDIKRINCVYSTEIPVKSTPPASISFTPVAAGNLIAKKVFEHLTK